MVIVLSAYKMLAEHVHSVFAVRPRTGLYDAILMPRYAYLTGAVHYS